MLSQNRNSNFSAQIQIKLKSHLHLYWPEEGGGVSKEKKKGLCADGDIHFISGVIT